MTSEERGGRHVRGCRTEASGPVWSSMLSNNPFSPLPPPRGTAAASHATATPTLALPPPFPSTSHREHPFHDPPLQPAPLSYLCTRPSAVEAYAPLPSLLQPHCVSRYPPPPTAYDPHPLFLSYTHKHPPTRRPLCFFRSLHLRDHPFFLPSFLSFCALPSFAVYEARPLTLCLLGITKFLHTWFCNESYFATAPSRSCFNSRRRRRDFCLVSVFAGSFGIFEGSNYRSNCNATFAGNAARRCFFFSHAARGNPGRLRSSFRSVRTLWGALARFEPMLHGFKFELRLRCRGIEKKEWLCFVIGSIIILINCGFH